MPTTTLAKPKKKLPPSQGAEVCAWIENNCIHGEGDFYGQPFILKRWQKAFLWRLYELKRTHRTYRQALLGLPRGNGKTQLAAAIAAYELLGTDRIDPVVVVAAASWEQADLVFGVLKTICRESPSLAGRCEVFDAEILRLDQPGRAYRVAAVAGTNEGQRPTCVIGDELHEWLGTKERVWTVLTSGAAKREDSLVLAITTAGWDQDSVCYRLYDQGKRIDTGELKAEGFLFEWYEAPAGAEIGDQEAWAVANPALGDFLPQANIVQQLRTIPEHEFARYHLNRWVTRAQQWLPLERWHPLAAPREVPERTKIVLGFDGSLNRDSTALMGCALDGYLFVIGAWERPVDAGKDWMVPRDEVHAAVERAFERYDVLRMACDRSWWAGEFQTWQERYGETRVIDVPNSTVRMAPASQRFAGAVLAGEGISHDGDPRLARHLQNCIIKETPAGERIVKESKDSPRKIDLAFAAVLAYDQAMMLANPKDSMYEDHALRSV